MNAFRPASWLFRLYLMVLAACLIPAGCQMKSRQVERGFYYWKTRFHLSAHEQQVLTKLCTRHLFIRLFDVDRDLQQRRVVPVASLHSKEVLPKGFSYTPVVFITQKALASLPEGEVDQLAAAIVHYSEQLCRGMGIRYQELQIDYDWTASTRDVYFRLLRAIKKRAGGKPISVTLRMHQIRHFLRVGVPPADRGLLMCYNMGTMKKFGTHNSILDVEEAGRYLKQMEHYPIALDVALPLFRWTLLYRRTQLRGILRDVQEAEVLKGPFETTGRGLYRCSRDTAWMGYQLAAGDVLKPEAVDIGDLKDMASFISKRMSRNSFKVLLFHADSLTLSMYSDEDLEDVFDRFD